MIASSSAKTARNSPRRMEKSRNRGRVSRRGGIELKRPMNDLHLVAILEPRERLLEAPLADVAPRTDDVGPDIDAHPLSIAVA
jgi:hypothetical protein